MRELILSRLECVYKMYPGMQLEYTFEEAKQLSDEDLLNYYLDFEVTGYCQ